MWKRVLSLENTLHDARQGLVAMTAFLAAAAFVTAIFKAIQRFSELEATLARVTGLLGASEGAIAGWGSTVSQVAIRTGRPVGDLRETLEQLAEEGTTGLRATAILRESAVASAVGIGEVGEIARTTAIALREYRGELGDGGQVPELLFGGTGESRLGPEAFRETVDKLLPSAAAANVEFERMISLIVAMSNRGETAAGIVERLRTEFGRLENSADYDILGSLGVPEASFEDTLDRVAQQSSEIRQTWQDTTDTINIEAKQALESLIFLWDRFIKRSEGFFGFIFRQVTKGAERAVLRDIADFDVNEDSISQALDAYQELIRLQTEAAGLVNRSAARNVLSSLSEDIRAVTGVAPEELLAAGEQARAYADALQPTIKPLQDVKDGTEDLRDVLVSIGQIQDPFGSFRENLAKMDADITRLNAQFDRAGVLLGQLVVEDAVEGYRDILQARLEAVMAFAGALNAAERTQAQGRLGVPREFVVPIRSVGFSNQARTDEDRRQIEARRAERNAAYRTEIAQAKRIGRQVGQSFADAMLSGEADRIGAALGGGVGGGLGELAGESIASDITGTLGTAVGAAAGPIGGALGSVLGSAIGELIGGDDPESRRLAELSKANTKALQEMTAGLRNTHEVFAGLSGSLFTDAQAAVAQAQLARSRPGAREGGRSAVYRGTGLPGAVLESSLLAAGRTTVEIEHLFRSFGLSLANTGENFRILDSEAQQLAEALKLSQQAFYESAQGQLSAAGRISGLLDESAAEQASRLADALTGPGGITGGLRDAVLASIADQDWQRVVDLLGDQFDLSQLGDLSLDEFLNYIGQIESLGDAAGDAADELRATANTLNAPSGFRAALHEYLAADPESFSTQAAEQARRASESVSSSRGDTWNFQPGAIQIDGRDKDGAELLDEIARASRELADSGGYPPEVV
ncbi:MAG: hypothetical protein OXE53_13085 [Deltaproteobacteria bacterium]|nr:hypothetical protein [Deltaproteobacteria bacterium]